MESNNLATIAALAAGFAGVNAFAAELKLTSSELDYARLYLQQSRDGVVGATKGLSEAQWKFKPAPERWSIAEILEHLVLTQEFVLGPVRQQLAKTPATTADRDNKRLDSVGVIQLPERKSKFQAPEMLQPTGRWTPSEALERLLNNYTRLTEYLESTPDLRQHLLEAPPIKAVSRGKYDSMDGYQWVLASAAHAERHTKQMLEVRADPNFPAK